MYSEAATSYAVTILVKVRVMIGTAVLMGTFSWAQPLPSTSSGRALASGDGGGSVARVLTSRVMVVVCRVVLGQFAMPEECAHHVVVVDWAAIPLQCAGLPLRRA